MDRSMVITGTARAQHAPLDQVGRSVSPGVEPIPRPIRMELSLG